jgi:hypothetical protein
VTRSRAIGCRIHDHFEIGGVIAISMATAAANIVDVTTGYAVLVVGCAAYVLGGRLLDRCCVRWCRQEFEAMGIDFDAVGN